MPAEHHALGAAGQRAALAHLGASLLLLALTIAIAPAKFERAGPVFAVLAAALLLGGAGSAHAAWSARARYGVALPGWWPLDRGWWAWDPPLRAFHWALCAHALLLTWVLILATVAFEAATGLKMPAALDAIVAGLGEWLTGCGAALLVAGGGTLLARRWARRTAP